MASGSETPSRDLTATERSGSLGPKRLPTRSLSVVGLVLFVLFATVVAGALVPFLPLEAAWQLRLAAALVNAASLPLMGLALLQMASALAPDDNLLKERHRKYSQLAVFAALGFLLLLPLQTVAGLRQSRAVQTTQTSRIQAAERKLTALRQAVVSAGSPADLNQQLRSLQGPVLGPADLAQPLPLLKAQVGAVLNQAEQQIAQQRQQSPPSNRWLLLPELGRNAIASFALAIGFAALAQRRGKGISLVQEWQASWQQWLERRRLGWRKDTEAHAQRPANGRSLLQEWQIQWRQGSERRRIRRLKASLERQKAAKRPPPARR